MIYLKYTSVDAGNSVIDHMDPLAAASHGGGFLLSLRGGRQEQSSIFKPVGPIHEGWTCDSI